MHNLYEFARKFRYGQTAKCSASLLHNGWNKNQTLFICNTFLRLFSHQFKRRIIVSTNLILTILLINRNNVFKPNVIHHSKSLGLNRDKYILIQRLCFCHIFLPFGFNLLYILNYVICGITEQSIFPC